MANIVEAKKTKPYSTKTYTTGDPVFSMREFNKHIMGNDNNNPSTAEAKAQKAAEKAAKDIGTISAQSPDGASSISTGTGMSLGGGEATGGGDCGGGMMEEFQLKEAKRYVRRYYMKPQNIFCSNKKDVLNALIDNEDQDCTIYTLNNLGDEKDITKLTSNDVIYYYEDGILYDKNRVKIMDYDLFIKHEENRPKIDINSTSNSTLSKVYHDRLTGMEDDDMDEAIEIKEAHFDPWDYVHDPDDIKSLRKVNSRVFKDQGLNKNEFIHSAEKRAAANTAAFEASQYKAVEEDTSVKDEFKKYIKENAFILDLYHKVYDKELEKIDALKLFDRSGKLKERKSYPQIKALNERVKQGCTFFLLKLWAAQFADNLKLYSDIEDFKSKTGLTEENELDLNFDDINAYGEKLTEGKEQSFTCCICGEEINGYGNNPAPYKKSGKCCDACNLKFVIPARIEQMNAEEN